MKSEKRELNIELAELLGYEVLGSYDLATGQEIFIRNPSGNILEDEMAIFNPIGDWNQLMPYLEANNVIVNPLASLTVAMVPDDADGLPNGHKPFAQFQGTDLRWCAVLTLIKILESK